MTTFKTDPQTKIFSFTVDGKIDGKAMRPVMDQLTAATGTDLRVLATLRDLDGISNIKELFGMAGDSFSLLGKVSKFAILTDNTLIKAGAWFDDKVFASLDARAFALGEDAAAKAWLTAPTTEQTLNTSTVDLGDNDVLGLKIAGKVSQADLDFIEQAFEAQLLTKDSLRLYIHIETLDGITLKALWNDLKLEAKYAGKLEKAALVTDYAFGAVASMADFVLPGTEVKKFDAKDAAAARAWIK